MSRFVYHVSDFDYISFILTNRSTNSNYRPSSWKLWRHLFTNTKNNLTQSYTIV